MIWAVLDTNVLVSGLGWPGALARIVDSAVRGEFVLVTSQVLLRELRRVLGYPRLSRAFADVDSLIRLVEEISVVVDPVVVVALSRDPDDDRVIEAAFAADADFVVTGEQDLLTLGSYEGVQIVSPATFEILLAQSVRPN